MAFILGRWSDQVDPILEKMKSRFIVCVITFLLSAFGFLFLQKCAYGGV